MESNIPPKNTEKLRELKQSRSGSWPNPCTNQCLMQRVDHVTRMRITSSAHEGYLPRTLLSVAVDRYIKMHLQWKMFQPVLPSCLLPTPRPNPSPTSLSLCTPSVTLKEISVVMVKP